MQTKRMSQAVLKIFFLGLLLISWSRLALAQGQMQMPPAKQNVLIIVMDDIGVDMVNCYWETYPIPQGWEGTAPITPNIDALAEAGTRFTNAWSSPVCTPTRAQIITGLQPSQTGMGVAFNRSHDAWPGLAAPWDGIGDFAPSAAVGKWHLAVETQQPSHPCDVGFGSFLGTFYNVNPLGDAITGCADNGPYMCWNRFDCTSSEPVKMQTYATAQTTDDAITKMEDLDAGTEPWLLYVAYHASHAPYHCPPVELYSSESGWIAQCDISMGAGPLGDVVYQTRAMTQAMDVEIGRLLDELDAIDGTIDERYANTSVILVGDNGTPNEATITPFNNSHGKASVYQGGINVPLIIRVAGAPMPQVANELVSTTDIYATAVQLLQSADYDEEMLENAGLDTRSMAALVDGDYGTFEPRDILFSESFSPNFVRLAPSMDLSDSLITTQHLRAVRNDKYKLLDWQQDGPSPNPGGKRAFYQLYNPALGEAPQDPAALAGTTGEGYGTIYSPMEEINLLTMPRVDWPTGASQIYRDLSAQLDSIYPPLPGGGLKPAVVLSTDGVLCSDSAIYVLRDALLGTWRSFLEFSIPANLDEVYSAHFFAATIQGGSSASRTLKLWPTHSNVSDNIGDCEALFESVDPSMDTPYAEVDGWTGENFGKVIQLPETAFEAIEDAADAAVHKFSIAITLSDESQDYVVRLRPKYEPSTEGNEKSNRLILRYRTSSGQLKTAEIPATPTRENALAQSYPNPFNPSTTIAYTVKEPSHVSLRIFDVSGALVRTLVNGMQPVGNDYSVVWDGRNDAGRAVSSGVYFYRLAIGDFVDSKKMVLLK